MSVGDQIIVTWSGPGFVDIYDTDTLIAGTLDVTITPTTLQHPTADSGTITDFDTAFGSTTTTFNKNGGISGIGVALMGDFGDDVTLTSSADTGWPTGIPDLIFEQGEEFTYRGSTEDDGAGNDIDNGGLITFDTCLLYTSPSPRDRTRSRMPSSA